MTARPLIVIPGDDPPQCQGSHHLERLAKFGEVKLYDNRPSSSEEQIERARDATAIINSRGQIHWTSEILRNLPKLKMITVCGIGTDAIDLKEARARGIVVSNVPGKTAPLVAEHALGLLMAVAKRATFQTTAMREGRWASVDGVFLRGKTLGVIGTGNIGAEMIRLGKAIGMNVIAWTFHPTQERAETLGVEYVDLDYLLSRSDVVSLHVQQTPETHHMIGEREFGIMKSTAILINTSRGPVVDEPALVKALQNALIGGAGLDVFETEPLPIDSPLRDLGDNVLLSPHMSSHNFGAGLTPGITWGTADILHALRGEDPEHVYNPEALPQWRERFAGRPLI